MKMVRPSVQKSDRYDIQKVIDEIFSATKLDVRKKKILFGSRESLMRNELADALPPGISL